MVSRKGALGMAAAGASAAAIAVVQGMGVAASTQSAGATVEGPSTLTQDQAISDGQLSLTTTKNSDGSVTSSYSFPSGFTAVSVSPPAGFSPLMATAAELTKYGFPPRPSSASDLQQWNLLMSAWKSTPIPKLTITTENLSGTAQSSLTSSTPAGSAPPSAPDDGTKGSPNPASGAYNANWAGWADYASSQAFFGAESNFIAPNLGPACPADPNGSFMAIWTGLGGFNTDPSGTKRLIQSGIYATGLGGPTVWAPFWEFINTTNNPNFPPQLLKAGNTAIAINPTDSLFSKTVYTPGSNESALFYLEDITTGQTASYTVHDNIFAGKVSNYFDGSTADFVAEFPGNELQPNPVETAMPFQQYAMVNNKYYDGTNWNTLGSHSHEQFTSTPWLTSGPIGADSMAFAVGFLGC